MEKQKKNIAGTVRDLVSPVADELGYMLWDVEYLKEGADMILRITIDKPEGIGIEDCERVSRAIDPILEEANPIEGFYYLEVSSPGVERELRTDEHIEASIGEKVEIKLFAPKNGIRSIVGILSSFEDGKISLSTDAETFVFERNEISKIKTVFFEN